MGSEMCIRDRLAPLIGGVVEGPNARAGIAVLVLLVVAALGNAAGWFVGVRARDRASSKFGRADSVAGSAVASEIRGSAVVRTLDAALPQPPSLLAQVRRLFNRFGFPDVFSGIPPLPAEPVSPPTQEEARAAGEAAASSTVQVIGPACDVIQEGSGFVAAEGYVVTNAHVVAGMDDPEVRSAVGGSTDATTVLFDPDLDLAILSVPDAPGPPLPLVTETPDRGAPGAVLGYPQGGPLDVRRAAVLRTIDALGPDIYGHGQVERLVLELQTLVRPGNSGGPFVLPDGRVAGIVFSVSSSDEDVGYAISATEVDDPLRSAIGLTTPVDTGPCID